MVFGGIFSVLCTAGSLELPGASSPGPSPGLCPGTTRRLIAPPPPDSQLLQAMKYGHCISCFRQDTTFIHALKRKLAHHSKFLQKGLLLAGLNLSFEDASVVLIKRFVASDVGTCKIHKLRTVKMRELEAPWLTKLFL